MKYIKQLDSIRAIAVFLVIFSHWITINEFVTKIELGAIGVDMFFVLSGFLITKILFDNRLKADVYNIPISNLLKNFYVRRTLRIFPIYYLVIFLLLIFQKTTGTDIKSVFMYFFTYTSNFYFFKTGTWYGILSHLWSLAVEEQFYLIWPWIILFVNRKYFLPVIVLFILIGVSSQYIMSGVKMHQVLTFTCFDAFGLGALLSWITTFKPDRLAKFQSGLSIAAIIAFAFFVFGIIQSEWIYIPQRTLVSILTLWLITYIVLYKDTEKLKFKFILNNKILIFFGKISYGIYLFHNIIPATINTPFINKYLNPLLPDLLYIKFGTPLFIIENAILVIVISWLSYLYIEKPFLNFKKYFEYKGESSVSN
jgi:peptidoglycan/LPS O-acetylase OafA/YrhL